MLAREIAGSHARVSVLGPPDRDLHYLQARPSMMQKLRRADLLIAVGADLEIGWLPMALRQAANPDVLPGRPGYFEFAAQVDLLDVGGAADRSLGDVHPFGNPHVHMDPQRMIHIALALAQRFAELDPQHAAHFYDHAERFADIVRQAFADWRALCRNAPGAVLFHQDANYLFYFLDVPIFGYLEPVPGVPPTAAHIKGLTNELAGRQGVVLHTVFQPQQAPKALAEALEWPLMQLSLEPPLDSGVDEYVEHLDSWVRAISAAAP
jgi:zinc/manganese transport system substrate-binding protein